jgi:elongator complex protein 1
MQNVVVVGASVVNLPEGAGCVCFDAPCDRLFCVSDDSLVVYGMSVADGHVFLRINLVEAGLAVHGRDKAIGIEFLADSNSLCVCLRNGDLISVPLKTSVPECVGTVDSGAVGMAWSPDGEFVVFATGNSTLFVLSRAWMPLVEVPLRSGAADAGGAPVSFSISFEGDGSRFATNTLFPDGSNQVAIWSRDCSLLSTCEAANQRGRAIAFRPSGFLVAASFCPETEEAAQIVLYESNGLAHGGFPLRCGRAVATSLCWSPDSTLLAVVCDGHLQVWRSSNYVWHLVWELEREDDTMVVSVLGWSQTLSGRLVVLEGRNVRLVDFVRSVSVSSQASQAPSDMSVACVGDGRSVRLTALRRAVLPPPLCEGTASFGFTVSSCVVGVNLRLAALGPRGHWAVVALDPSNRNPQQGSLVHGRLKSHKGALWMQLVWISQKEFVALASDGNLAKVDSESGHVVFSEFSSASSLVRRRLYCNLDSGMLLLVEGALVRRIEPQLVASDSPVAVFPEPCMDIAATPDGLLLFGRSARFKLYGLRLDRKSDCVLVEGECTSFCLHSRFLVLSSLSSHLRFASLQGDGVPRVDSQHDRLMETGATLVACLPLGCRTIVEAPRGSLETVYPRILVGVAADKLVDEKQLRCCSYVKFSSSFVFKDMALLWSS